MIRRPPRSTRTYTLFPYTTLFRSTHTLRGVLQLPEGDGPHPIVIMAHGQGGLKEWPNIPSVSAVLCAAGIATLAFDYRNFGDSDGAPRDDVDFHGQIEDFQCEFSFASPFMNIDRERMEF